MIAKLETVVLFLVLLLLPTQLGKHFWPQFSFVYSLPVDYLSPTIYFWDLLVMFLIFLFVLKKESINKVALNLFFIFILSQSISLIPLLINFNIGSGLVRLEQYFICGMFGVFLASQKLGKLLKLLFWPIMISIFFESILAAIQFLKGSSIGLWIVGERSFSISSPAIAKFDFYGSEFLRPYATFPHPNVLAAFLLVMILLLLTIYNFNFQRREKIFFFLNLVLASFTIFLTVSRTVFFTQIVASLIFLRQNKWLLGLALVLVLLSPIIYTRYVSLFDFDNLTILRREELTLVAFNLFQNSPIFGVGLNNFIIAASDEIISGPNRFLQPVHNIFLLMVVETGIVGFFGFLVFWGITLFGLLKKFKYSPCSRHLLLVILVIFFLGLFDHYFLTLPQGYRLLFLVWGLSLSKISSTITE